MALASAKAWSMRVGREDGEDRAEVLVGGERVVERAPGRRSSDRRTSRRSARRGARATRSVRRPRVRACNSRRWASASMTGPMVTPGADGWPSSSSSVCATSRSTMGSYTARWTMSREAAEHFWPAKPNALAAMPGTASSGSASASTMIGFLPPSSVITRLIWRCPGRIRAAACEDRQADGPGAGEGDRPPRPGARPGGRRPPRPGRAGTTGRRRAGRPPPAPRRGGSATAGVCSAGLKQTALPATSAAVTMPVGMASGKFHGAMTAATPRAR